MGGSAGAVPSGCNQLTIAGSVYLIVGVSSSHLARRAASDAAGVPAVPDWLFETEEPWQTAYDVAEIRRPAWSPHTVCGIEWQMMESADGPLLRPWNSRAYAPSCKRCLRVVSSDLEDVPADERIPLIVGMVVEEVLADAMSVVRHVPGEQMETLRAALRRRFRRLGVRCRNYPAGSDLHIFSEELWDTMPAARQRELEKEAVNALGAAFYERATPRRGIDWRTWGLD